MRADVNLMTDPRTSPARIGVALVASIAVILAASVWWLPGTHADKSTACAVAVAMVAGALALRATTRAINHPLCLLGYPLIVLVGLACIGGTTTNIAFSYGGLLTMAIIFVGLYAPAKAGYSMLAPAATSWLFVNGVITQTTTLRSIEVRLPLALIIWSLVISLLSQHSAATVRSTASLLRQAQRDPLTGLHNRRVLTEVLAAATPGDVVIIIDIDHFKGINDGSGHRAGDDLLTNFARVLVRDIRENDMAIRFGGDEFVLYLPNISIETAKTVLERFHLDWSRQPDTATFSAGVAAVRSGRDGADAFGEADRLLYDAKAAGRNQWATPADDVATALSTSPRRLPAR